MSETAFDKLMRKIGKQGLPETPRDKPDTDLLAAMEKRLGIKKEEPKK